MRAANNRLQWTVKDNVPTHHGNYGRTKVSLSTVRRQA